jgi:hypothetical protein
MEPIEPPWQAIKEWIPDYEPDFDWFNRPRNPNEPAPDWFDQTPTWKTPEISPLFPASGPATGFFIGLHPKANS